MAKSFLPQLKLLQDFFGSPPALEYADIPLEQNNFEFLVELENGSVWFKLIGSQNRGELRVVAKPFGIVKLVLADIARISVRKTKEDHYLRVQFSRKHSETLELSLRPKVMLFWGNETRERASEESNIRSVTKSDQ